MKYSTNIQVILLSVLLGLLTGCGQLSQQQQATPQEEPLPTASIAADCVVNYFQTDKAPYITQQQHYFNPKAGYLQIVSTEPTGQYKFTLNKGNFTLTKQPTEFLSGLPGSFVNQPLATALFYCFTAGGGLLDTDQYIISDNVKIEGQWFLPIQISATNGIQLTLLRNLDTGRIELVQVQETVSGTQWLLRCYNLRYRKDLGKLLPRKIDLFDIQNGLASKQLIIQFEYKNIVKQ